MRDEQHYATGIYANSDHQAAGQKTSRIATPLDNISDQASAAARIGDLIQEFIDRCRGERDEGVAADRGIALGPIGHFAQLDRLQKNLARAEELARELGSIG